MTAAGRTALCGLCLATVRRTATAARIDRGPAVRSPPGDPSFARCGKAPARRAAGMYLFSGDIGHAPPRRGRATGAAEKDEAWLSGLHRMQAGGPRGRRPTRTSVNASQCGQRKCQGGGASTVGRTTMTTASKVCGPCRPPAGTRAFHPSLRCGRIKKGQVLTFNMASRFRIFSASGWSPRRKRPVW